VLLEPVLEHVRESSVPDALVVLGAHDVETSAPTVRCPEWERGRGASLRCGLRALPPETVALLEARFPRIRYGIAPARLLRDRLLTLAT